jgi:hypothetical protein
MLDRFDRQIDVEVRPMEMVGSRPFDVSNPGNGLVFEPGEFTERKEEPSVVHADPEPCLGDVYNFSLQSAAPRLF